MTAAVIAVIARKERDLVDVFRAARAVSVQSAQPRSSLGLDQSVAWGRMERRAIIRAAPNGDYWLDEPSWEAMQAQRPRRAVIILAVVLAAVALGMLMRTAT